MKQVSTKRAPKPLGHYSQAMVHGDLVCISGQLPVDSAAPATGELRVGSIKEQTERVLKNLKEVLIAVGSDIDHLIKTTVYISDIELWDQVNAVYASFFGAHRPARVVVPTKDLHFGFQIEIEAIAALL